LKFYLIHVSNLVIKNESLEQACGFAEFI